MIQSLYFHYGLYIGLFIAWIYLCAIIFQRKRNVCPRQRKWMTVMSVTGIGLGLLLFSIAYLLLCSQQGRLQMSDPFVLGMLWIFITSLFFLFEGIQLMRDQSVLCDKSDTTLRFLYITMTVLTGMIFGGIIYWNYTHYQGYDTDSYYGSPNRYETNLENQNMNSRGVSSQMY